MRSVCGWAGQREMLDTLSTTCSPSSSRDGLGTKLNASAAAPAGAETVRVRAVNLTHPLGTPWSKAGSLQNGGRWPPLFRCFRDAVFNPASDPLHGRAVKFLHNGQHTREPSGFVDRVHLQPAAIDPHRSARPGWRNRAEAAQRIALLQLSLLWAA